MNKNKFGDIFSIMTAAACVVLLCIKFYYMESGNFPQDQLREFRKEYRDLFEYSLSPEAKDYWLKVINNYHSLIPSRQDRIKQKISKKQWIELSETIRYLNLIVSQQTPLIPQKVKDNIIFFKQKNIYEYLFELQSPVLEATQ